MENIQKSNKIGYAVGTGRCGTKFLSLLLALEPEVSSVHERNRLNETFHRYCKWYNLPVDNEGFLYTKEQEIKNDLKYNNFSFEASAHLSLSIVELFNRFNSKFILLVRSPEKVVNSYLKKGWYKSPIVRSNNQLALGYQKNECFHHFLGRIVPMGKKFIQWNKMTRVGKLAWYWNELNKRIIRQFDEIPKTHWTIVKLEELNYERYKEILKFLGINSLIKERVFNSLVKKRPNAIKNVPKIESWTSKEIKEFEEEVEPMSIKFGYEYKLTCIIS